MQIVERSVEELIPYENNPRNNGPAVEKVAASIKAFGFKVPIIVDKDDVIVAGHTRLLAAKELGIKVVPCIVADDLTEAQVKAFRLADNKVSEFSSWDFAKLSEEMASIQCLDLDGNIDMTEFGFIDSEGSLDGFFEDNPEPNGDADTTEEATALTVVVACENDDDVQKVLAFAKENGLKAESAK
ncbi:MAG: ParB N-terminal domain-containing protein [Veillonellaceae bacterium]|nr:ParB N-terminal domain-containing protein [Veillonellaceae bacterium]